MSDFGPRKDQPIELFDRHGGHYVVRADKYGWVSKNSHQTVLPDDNAGEVTNFPLPNSEDYWVDHGDLLYLPGKRRIVDMGLQSRQLQARFQRLNLETALSQVRWAISQGKRQLFFELEGVKMSYVLGHGFYILPQKLRIAISRPGLPLFDISAGSSGDPHWLHPAEEVVFPGKGRVRLADIYRSSIGTANPYRGEHLFPNSSTKTEDTSPFPPMENIGDLLVLFFGGGSLIVVTPDGEVYDSSRVPRGSLLFLKSWSAIQVGEKIPRFCYYSHFSPREVEKLLGGRPLLYPPAPSSFLEALAQALWRHDKPQTACLNGININTHVSYSGAGTAYGHNTPQLFIVPEEGASISYHFSPETHYFGSQFGSRFDDIRHESPVIIKFRGKDGQEVMFYLRWSEVWDEVTRKGEEEAAGRRRQEGERTRHGATGSHDPLNLSSIVDHHQPHLAVLWLDGMTFRSTSELREAIKTSYGLLQRACHSSTYRVALMEELGAKHPRDLTSYENVALALAQFYEKGMSIPKHLTNKITQQLLAFVGGHAEELGSPSEISEWIARLEKGVLLEAPLVMRILQKVKDELYENTEAILRHEKAAPRAENEPENRGGSRRPWEKGLLPILLAGAWARSLDSPAAVESPLMEEQRAMIQDPSETERVRQEDLAPAEEDEWSETYEAPLEESGEVGSGLQPTIPNHAWTSPLTISLAARSPLVRSAAIFR